MQKTPLPISARRRKGGAYRAGDADLRVLFGLKGYSSVGRAAVSKTAGRKFEPYCPCHFLTRKRATSLHGEWGAGYPANSPNVDFLLLKWESAFM